MSIGAPEDCNPSFLPGPHSDGTIAEVRISDMAPSPGQFLGAASAVPEPRALALVLLLAFGVRNRGVHRQAA